MKLRPEGLPYMLFLGALAALPPIATDLALPALVDMAQSLGTSASVAGLTLSLFMLGFALSPFVYGPLSDKFGRRPSLLLGMVVFVVGSLLTTIASSGAMLLAARVLQGAGAGAGMTLAFAVVRDGFIGRAAQKRLAMITVVANTAPIVAPALGSGLLALGGWRGVYGVIFVWGVALLLVIWLGFAESRRVAQATGPAGDVSGTVTNAKDVTNAKAAPSNVPSSSYAPSRKHGKVYARLVAHAQVRGNVLTNGLGFAWMFSYVAGSPLLLLDVWHLPTWLYALMFACTGAGIVAGATLNSRLSGKGVSPQAILFSGIVLAMLSTASLIGFALMGQDPGAGVAMPLLVVATFSFGLVAPSSTHGALGPLPELAGATGGLLTSIQMLFGAAGSSVVVLLFPRFGLLAMAGVMFGAALLAAIVYFPLFRERRLAMA